MTHRILTKAERVANYLFCEMCCNSDAMNAQPEFERWYEDGLDFYHEVLKAAGEIV